MKKIVFFSILLSFLLLLFYCGSSKDKIKNIDNKIKTDKSVAKKNMTKFSNYEVDDTGERIPEIKAITFTGKPFENHDLKADVHLSIPSEDIEFSYNWFINDKIIKDNNSATLPKEFIKSGDWVFCKVKIIGLKTKTPEVKSKYIRILGTTPILNLSPIPDITIPGEFRYKIDAKLPGEESSDSAEENEDEDFSPDFIDNSGLVFTLISPTDKDISLDENTGEIIWFISTDLAYSLGNGVEIKFKVSNPEGGSVISSIKLSFKKPESDEEPQIP